MSARDELIAHAKAQRDAELDALIAKIDALRGLQGYELLRGYALQFTPDDPGFEQAAAAACMMLDGAPDPADADSVSFRPTEQQPEAVFVFVSWRNHGATERRVFLDALERAWTTAGVAVRDARDAARVRNGGWV